MAMEPPPRPTNSLFDVFLRLRPSISANAARFLDVEETSSNHPTHITIKPPSSDHRKRAVEKFAFTRVFEQDAVQLDIFNGTGILPLIEGVLAAESKHGRDGLLATLGVTGSGKSHTILGSKSQRGMTQMALDVLFRSIGSQLVQSLYGAPAFSSIASSDASDAHIFTATAFLDSMYGDNQSERFPSRGTTPMPDCSSFLSTVSRAAKNIPRPSLMPQEPAVQDIVLAADPNAEYAIVVSMYEVYNDRIFDLLTGRVTKSKNPNVKRRALLFKNTEHSPDRKVVAGLTKIICGCFEEALMVLETGLMERKVAGTGSNAVSSRSHGFFCIEVKKRNPQRKSSWSSSTLTIVDLAGSERARNAKTAGETLAEAGKINESLMYLGQCMQMQSDNQEGNRKNIVPFRQCKLTELLFSNSFTTPANTSRHHHTPQKGIMIVTADPKGDLNATSQILRYSALAREVTVPRIPSTTSTILSGAPLTKVNSGSSGRQTPHNSWEELDAANAEIQRLTSEIEIFALRLNEEMARRKAAEQSWRAAEEHMLDLEQEIREECFAETETAVEAERRRWQAAWDAEADQHDEHMDRKIDVVIRATRAQANAQKQEIKIYEDPDPELRERVEQLERENEELRSRLERREQEAMARSASPVKKQRVLKAKKWEDPEGSAMMRSGIDFE
ncbi:kinesin [Delitschia confertaspora ATCC 74209]|uniref:Kinesin-like protein n=1 Tax=Delitschia confertaspora ATCC 74209 TaxID=1513339 RepID=A0A9P4JWK6_9PLEO|nr:kinesin [Delitschia confertaspora ATCC 74209]